MGGTEKKNSVHLFGVAIGVVGRWCCGMGQNWGNRNLILVPFWAFPRAPKKNFGFLYFSIFDLACACLIEIILFSSK